MCKDFTLKIITVSWGCASVEDERLPSMSKDLSLISNKYHIIPLYVVDLKLASSQRQKLE